MRPCPPRSACPDASASGPRSPGSSCGSILLIGSAAVGDHVRWRRTRYRIGAERVELHTGLFLVKKRSLARERIRSVDLTAHPLQRALGLVTVRIGTGEHSGNDSTLELDPVPRSEGERLRRELLERTATGTPGTHCEGELAALDPRWIRYAPVSFVAPALGGAAAGAVMQVSDWFGAQGQVIEWIGDRFRDTSLPAMIVILALAAVLAGVVGALGLWVEMWWNYRLEREPGGTLRIRRGLLTSRSVSIEERRLRGVELVEPLGIRTFGAARVDAITTGLAKDDEEQHGDHNTLLPAAPRPVADAVAADVLREITSPTGAPLTGHPLAARGRRLRRAFWAVVAPVSVLVLLGVLLTPVLLWIALAWAVVGLLGRGAPGPGRVPRPGTRHQRRLPGGEVRQRPALDRRAGAGRSHRLDGPADVLPAAGRGAERHRDDGRRSGRVHGVRHGHGRGPRLRLRGRARPAGTLPGARPAHRVTPVSCASCR